MTDSGLPSNGGRRFDDLVRLVERIDAKVDLHGEQLASIKTQLGGRPCLSHQQQLQDLQVRQERVEGGAQVSVAKIAGMAGFISAIVSAVGAYFMAKGSP